MANVYDERWLSVDEIATYLGVKRDTIYKWIGRKELPAHKVGSLWKFQKAEIDEWVRPDHASDSTTTRKPH
jgi:excisionase family DNA binding protein